MKNRELDDLFRKHLREQEVAPPEALWDNIQTQLDQQVPLQPLKRKPARSLRWVPYAAAASLLLILGITYLTTRDPKDPTGRLATTQEILPPAERRVYASPNEPVQEHNDQREERPEAFTEKKASKPTNVLAARPTQVLSGTAKPNASEQHRLQADVPEPTDTITERYAPIAPIAERLLVDAIPVSPEKPIYVEVTEVEPIKPLIESIDDEEDGKMYASEQRKIKGSILSGITSLISENISAITGKEVSIGTDEEGSLRIDLGNTLVRTKKRK